MTATTYRVKTGIHYPEPGHVPPFGQRCDPKHEASPEIGAVVDLSHLSEVALDFFLRNNCIEPAEATATHDTDEGGN